MALRRSLQLLERADVAPALKKLWKKHVPVNGMITQHLSPFEQHVVSPLFKDFNKKVLALCMRLRLSRCGSAAWGSGVRCRGPGLWD